MRLLMTRAEVEREERAARDPDTREGDYLPITRHPDGSLSAYLTFNSYDMEVPITVTDAAGACATR